MEGERRSNVRIPLSVPVIIYRDGAALAPGITRDVSSAGLYIWAETPDLERRAPVEIYWWMSREQRGAGQGRNMPMRARVTHRDAEGFGLRFDATDAATCETLHRLLAQSGELRNVSLEADNG
ncbi:MAG: PilZ domain-containing protein [Gammaproteobacteria bacterium]